MNNSIKLPVNHHCSTTYSSALTKTMSTLSVCVSFCHMENNNCTCVQKGIILISLLKKQCCIESANQIIKMVDLYCQCHCNPIVVSHNVSPAGARISQRTGNTKTMCLQETKFSGDFGNGSSTSPCGGLPTLLQPEGIWKLVVYSILDKVWEILIYSVQGSIMK